MAWRIRFDVCIGHAYFNVYAVYCYGTIIVIIGKFVFNRAGSSFRDNSIHLWLSFSSFC